MEYYKNCEWLKTQYIDNKKTCEEIGKICGVSKTTILMWLYKFEIKKRPLKNKNIDYRYLDKDFLNEMHNVNKMTIREISKMCNVSDDTIIYHMRKNNISHWRSKIPVNLSNYIDEIIAKYINDKISANQLAIEYNTYHSTIIDILKRNNIPIRNVRESMLNYLYDTDKIDRRFFDYEWLYDAHWNVGMSVKEIAMTLNIGEKSIRTQMHSHGIPTRNNSESKIGLMVGDKHPNWKGGITSLNSLLREYFNINIAKEILVRDGYTCQLCGSKSSLHVHHKKHFSEIVNEIMSEHPELKISNVSDRLILYKIIVNDFRFTDTSNLITYCKYCHLFKIHGYNKRG